MKILDRIKLMSEGVVIAFDSIRANKVRASLTILGVAVGVFVVTGMSATVQGINAGVSASLAAAGPTTFFVTRWPVAISSCNGSSDSCPWRHNAPLSLDDAHVILRQPGIRGVIVHVSSSAQVKYRGNNLPSASVDAYTADWTDINSGNMVAGRNFTEGENTDASSVAVINVALRKQLFPDLQNEQSLGKEILIGANPFRVIGVWDQTGSLFDDADQPKATVPFESAYRKLNFGIRWLDLTVKPRDGVTQDVAMDQAIAALRIRRQLKPAQDNTFFVSTPEKVMELYNDIVGKFFAFMIGLSAIGLMVGGVGVIAIMMISVTERTREIGVRKALGATRLTILWQFLVEAATLTMIGAIAGLIVGGGLTLLIRTKTSIHASMPPWAVVAALAGAALTGILFGLLPAIRASKLDPVEALRYE
ncbi:MAG TPA: ABC transporter permease [Gemmatimonadaceae bacterium]|nr:ABC transporter permease [Gemmatimonadaceae bacterium]